jgi:hypothetical protein
MTQQVIAMKAGEDSVTDRTWGTDQLEYPPEQLPIELHPGGTYHSHGPR